MNDTASALLTAILANPADDWPRLVLADWLEENGQIERAEFIRVQCRLAGLGECLRWFESGLSCACPFCTAGGMTLRRREQLLLSREQDCVREALRHGAGDVFWEAWEFRRGFVYSISLTCANWLEHAAALCAAAPIRVVVLTTLPRCRTSYLYHRNPELHVDFDAPLIGSVVSFLEMAGTTYAQQITLAVTRSLTHTWPHIKFTLPPTLHE